MGVSNGVAVVCVMVVRGAAYPVQKRWLYRTPAAVTKALLEHVFVPSDKTRAPCAHGA